MIEAFIVNGYGMIFCGRTRRGEEGGMIFLEFISSWVGGY